MTDTGHLLTSEQAGLLLNKSGRTVRRMADAGLLRIAHRLPGANGAYLFTRDDVEALVVRAEKAS